MPLLDRNGYRADAFVRDPEGAARIVDLASVEAVLAEAGPETPIGLDLPNHVHPEIVLPWQDRLSLIAVMFPKFTDGRGFSLARMLRDQGYRGILRATGWILPDQFAFALDCGFDEIEIAGQSERQPLEDWLRQPEYFSFSYQDSHDGRLSIFRRRAAGAAS